MRALTTSATKIMFSEETRNSKKGIEVKEGGGGGVNNFVQGTWGGWKGLTGCGWRVDLKPTEGGKMVKEKEFL